MVFLQFLQHFFRRLLRIDLSRGLDKRTLILAQLGVAQLQKFRQRHIDHFVIEKFLSITLHANRERAVRAWQQILLQPCLIVFQGRDRLVVAVFEVREQGCVLQVFERFRHGRLKEVNVTRQLLDGDVRVNLRRITQYRPSLRQRARNLFLALDH